MARLKVFAARIGFFETVVSASSQKAALAAWGTRQNLFAEGMASVTEEPEAVRAALAEPGVVLRRAVGGKGPYAAQTPPKAPAGAPRRRGPPDRSDLTRAEDAAARARTKFEAERSELEAERASIDAKIAALEQAREKASAKEATTIDEARRAWRAAGGKD